MEILIACDDPSISTRIRGCLHNLGVECSLSQVLSRDSAKIVAATPRGKSPLLIFFGSPQLSPGDLSFLSELCAIGGDHVKVVAVGQGFTASAILQAVRCGAVDCLSLNGTLESELRHLLGRLETAQGDRTRSGKLFTVISAVGGAGASLVATNLAAVIAHRQQQCGLLDLHWRGGDLATLLSSTPRHTLLSLANKLEHLDRTMLEQSLVRHECGIHLLASPEPFSDYRQIRPELIQKIVQLARSMFSTVVVDLEDCEHLDQVRTLAASDQIILVLRPDFVSLVRTKKLVSYLIAANVAKEHIVLVANRTGHSRELPSAQVEGALGMPIHHQVSEDPAAVNESINLGIPLVIACPKAKAAIGVARLAESLLGIPCQTASASWPTGRMFPVSMKSMACLFSAAIP
jgi:pilus assembly protein CpaE